MVVLVVTSEITKLSTGAIRTVTVYMEYVVVNFAQTVNQLYSERYNMKHGISKITTPVQHETKAIGSIILLGQKWVRLQVEMSIRQGHKSKCDGCYYCSHGNLCSRKKADHLITGLCSSLRSDSTNVIFRKI